MEANSTTQTAIVISARALASKLSISVRQVWRLRSAGKLPKPVTLGGSIRWRGNDIERWCELGCPSQDEFETRIAADNKNRH